MSTLSGSWPSSRSSVCRSGKPESRQKRIPPACEGRGGVSCVHDVVANGVTHHLDDGTQAELPHDVRSMRLDGPDADAEDLRHLLVALSFRHELDDLSLARRQGLPGPACGARPPRLHGGWSSRGGEPVVPG